MSLESSTPNDGSQQPASTYKPENTGSSPKQPTRNNTWIYLGVIAVLLGACIYLFMSRKTTIEQVQVVSSQRDSAVAAHESLNTDYQAAIARLDQLSTTNSQLNNEIKDKDGELQTLRQQLQTIMSKQHRSQAENAKARALIAKLNAKVSSYEERIAELEGKNKELTEQNSSLNTQNTGLQRQVKLGAVLHASNIRMEAIHLKRGGKKEVETSKARRADLIRITFDIDENRIAESGTKEIFLRITGPDGRLLSNAAYGSGVTSLDDGQQLSYTLSKQVSLQQNTPVPGVQVDWKQDSDYERGTYTIDLYNGGFRIGGGSVTLR